MDDDERRQTYQRLVSARQLIQAAYDRLVDHWGNDGSTLKDDYDYVPELNLIRDMYQWLQQDQPDGR